MKRPDHPKIISGNDLRLGHVIYLGSKGWVADIKDAQLFPGKEQAEAALTANDDLAIVVGAYIVDRPKDALHIREAIRADGPTIPYITE